MKTRISVFASLWGLLIAFCASTLHATPVVLARPYTLGENPITDFVALPASENLLYLKTPTIVANSRPGQEGTASSASVLTDGLIPSNFPMNSRYTLGDNAILEWTFDDAKSLTDVRIFSLWGNDDRNCIVVQSIEIKNLDNNWETLPNSAFGYSKNADYNTIGEVARPTKRYVQFYDDSGVALSPACKGLRINFGYQDNAYGGFMEIEARGGQARMSLGGIADVLGNGITYTHTADADVYTYTSTGILVANADLYATRVVKNAQGEILSEAPFCKLSSNQHTEISVEPDTTVEMHCVPWVESLVYGASVSGVTGQHVTTTETPLFNIYTFRDTESASSITFDAAGFVDVLVVGGGGGGGYTMGGGGGAGGVIYQESLFVQPGTLEITVGAGGASAPNEGTPGGNGGNSSFGDLILCYGGGGGASWASYAGLAGGSGGGSSHRNITMASGIAGQGNHGGPAYSNRAGGGGGAGSAGESGHLDEEVAGSGGDGIASDITGEFVYYGGGGGAGCGHTSWEGGSASTVMPGKGGKGGGGDGAPLTTNGAVPGFHGTDGLGGGGGGGSYGMDGGLTSTGGKGGSGVVIVRVLQCDLTDATPDFLFLKTEDKGPTSVEFFWRTYSFGTDATAVDVLLRYGTDPEELNHEVVLAQGVTQVGPDSATLDRFSPGKTYYGEIVIQSNAPSAPTVTSQRFTFAATAEELTNSNAGLWQVRFDGLSEWNASVLDVAIGSADTQRQRVLGAAMAYVTTTYVNELDPSAIYSWADNRTWAYAGYIYLEQGLYTTVSSIDDTAFLAIDGVTVHRTDAYVKDFTSTWQCPATGWHAIDIRVGNGTHGAGPMSGVSPQDAFRFKRANELVWHTFLDPGDASLLCTSFENALTIDSYSRAGDTLRLALSFDPKFAGGTLDFCYADSYAADETDWTILPLGTIANGSSQRQDIIDVPASTAFIRYRITFDGVPFRSATLNLIDVPTVQVADPAIAYLGVQTSNAGSADLNLSVLTTGEGATTCDVILSYGTSPETLSRTTTFPAQTTGNCTLHIANLLPGHTYYGSFSAVNAVGGSATPTPTFEFSTATIPDPPASSALPGLWQARVRGSQHLWDTDILALDIGPQPDLRHRTLGAQMAYTVTSRNNDFDSFTEQWSENITWVTTGYMYFEAGTYTFSSSFDDNVYFAINGTLIHNSGGYKANARSSWTCPATDWYPITIGLGNGGSAAGPMGGYTAEEGFRFSTNNGATWHTFVDPGDGSLLRTDYPVRELNVDSYSFSNTTLSATLTFGTPLYDTDTLHVAYGATYGGDTPSTWEYTADLANIPAATTTYTVSNLALDPSIRFVRFYFGDDAQNAWAPTLVRVDPSIPALAQTLTLDGHLGDTIIASGTLLSAGAPTATVTLEVSTTPEMTHPISWPVGDLASGDNFTVTLHTSDLNSPAYLTPGATYYVRAKAATATDLDVLPATEITLPGTPAYGDATASSSLWNATFNLPLTAVGAGNGTRVTLLTGDAGALTNTASTVTTTPGTITFPVEFPFLNRTVSYAFLIEAECDTVQWSILTPSQTIDLKNTATFSWKPSVTEGAWNDPTCWTSSINDPRSTYPNSTSSNASFSECTQPTTVHVEGAYQFKQLIAAPTLDLTFIGIGQDASQLRMTDSPHTPIGFSLTLRNLYLYNSNSWIYSVPENGTLRLLDGAFFQGYGHLVIADYPNTLLELRGDSLIELTDGTFYMSHENAHLILDDSTLRVNKQGLHLAHSANTINNLIEFYGTHPLLAGRTLQVGENTDGITVGEVPTFLFHAPRGGYQAAPIRNVGVNWGTVSSDDKLNLRLVLAKDSPLCADRKASTILLDWPYGILSHRVEFTQQELDSSTTYYYTWNGAAQPPAPDALPTAIWVTYEQNPTLILFR